MSAALVAQIPSEHGMNRALAISGAGADAPGGVASRERAVSATCPPPIVQGHTRRSLVGAATQRPI